ncbi:precorrin methylase [Sphingomonas sp. AAP5]|uniref:cobalamin biosynthesis protein n=1 Tax=Sphingomonas sp. AAP5 TaxID=1523415 RepID=UPI001057146C|nr:cobalamin biosynthesis protein [Sphingomonas sp. AAP5]QBM75203.1 precorrin methylase [Sphingomonas sp. AAP5]
MERDAVIVAGFGYRTGAQADSLSAAFDLARAGHPPVTALAAPADKTALLAALAETLDIPLIAVAPPALRATPTPTQSPASLAARGAGSVAEAAALAAAGPGARLIAHRHISPDRMASCAIAERFDP